MWEGWACEVSEVIDVSSEQVGDGRLGAGAEEGALGLAVVELGREFVECCGVGGGGGGKEVGDEGGAANRKAKEADAAGEFRLGGAVGREEIEGSLEVMAVGGREEWKRGGAGDGCEDLGFDGVEADAVWGAKLLETDKKPEEIDVLKEGDSVVKVAGGGGGDGGAGGGVTSTLAIGKFLVEWNEDAAKDESGESAAEGAALGKSFVLGEMVPLAVGGLIPGAIGILVKEVEVGQKNVEVRKFGEFVAASVARDGVKHIGNI
jgi:hypothetical protein